MTTVKQYVAGIRPVAVNVGKSMGCDISRETLQLRIILNLVMGMVCVLLKLLVDNAVITDAQVQAAFGAFMADPTSYPDVPVPPDPII
jgi:hypothetical protein